MITTTNANNILRLYFGQATAITGSGKCYLGLSTTTPAADGSNFTEPATSTGYARVQINIKEAEQYTNLMGTPESGAITNIKEITFPEAISEGGFGTVTHFGVFGEKTGGIPLYVHALTAPNPDATGSYPAQPVNVDKGEVLLFRQGALSLEFAVDA